MTRFTSDELFDFLIAEAEAHFSGWDFSYIADREAQAPLRWSYVSEALLRVRKSKAVLDMDTGGGEMFSYFAPLHLFFHLSLLFSKIDYFFPTYVLALLL